jgi:hypothetical protein
MVVKSRPIVHPTIRPAPAVPSVAGSPHIRCGGTRVRTVVTGVRNEQESFLRRGAPASGVGVRRRCRSWRANWRRARRVPGGFTSTGPDPLFIERTACTPDTLPAPRGAEREQRHKFLITSDMSRTDVREISVASRFGVGRRAVTPIGRACRATTASRSRGRLD